MELTKRELRERSSQLRSILCDWDPIGVMSISGWPRDEYDCLVGSLLRLMQSGATDDALVEHLRREIADHFGLAPDRYDFAAVARRARIWFDRGWRDLAGPVTLFVALLDEGVDVWRPVQARPLGGGMYRIVGVEVDVSDERWQFPAGAIVRGDQRRFADGTTGVVAVEQVEGAG